MPRSVGPIGVVATVDGPGDPGAGDGDLANYVRPEMLQLYTGIFHDPGPAIEQYVGLVEVELRAPGDPRRARAGRVRRRLRAPGRCSYLVPLRRALRGAATGSGRASPWSMLVATTHRWRGCRCCRPTAGRVGRRLPPRRARRHPRRRQHHRLPGAPRPDERRPGQGAGAGRAARRRPRRSYRATAAADLEAQTALMSGPLEGETRGDHAVRHALQHHHDPAPDAGRRPAQRAVRRRRPRA